MTEKNQIAEHESIDESIVFSQGRYKIYTSEASKQSRQLAFAEGAIFWAIYFQMQNVSKWILVSFYFFLFLFFVFDLLQYLYGANKFESEEDAIKKFQTSNKGKEGINYEIGDNIGNNIKKIFNIKLFMLGISTLFLTVVFVSFPITITEQGSYNCEIKQKNSKPSVK